MFKIFVLVALPKFFGKNDPKLRQTPDVNLLDYFLSAQHDGASISWVHGINSRKALIDALRSLYKSSAVVLVLVLINIATC